MLHFSVSLPELSTHLDYSKSKMTSDQFPKAPPVQCLSDLQDLDWTANPDLHETPRRSCNAGCDWAAITVLWVDEAFMVHDSCTTRYTALYIMHAHINTITIRSPPPRHEHIARCPGRFDLDNMNQGQDSGICRFPMPSTPADGRCAVSQVFQTAVNTSVS
jgi:hypothetical protein